jgi:excisionase family DNA binding protein
MGKLLTVPQLAQILQVKPSTIYAWTRQGKIPHIRAGRLIRFRPDQAEEILRSGCPGSRPPALGGSSIQAGVQ